MYAYPSKRKRIIFFFYSNENVEPCHVHVEKGSAEGKLWLEPFLKIEFFKGFNNSEEKKFFEHYYTKH